MAKHEALGARIATPPSVYLENRSLKMLPMIMPQAAVTEKAWSEQVKSSQKLLPVGYKAPYFRRGVRVCQPHFPCGIIGGARNVYSASWAVWDTCLRPFFLFISPLLAAQKNVINSLSQSVICRGRIPRTIVIRS